MSHLRIAAVVVTYNRLTLLQECIEAIRTQSRPVDELIVVNNGSTDGTSEWLSKQTDLTVVTQTNQGSAGGQFTGIKTAYERGNEWFWCMDDDGRPAITCLQNLLKFTNQGFDWLNSLVIDKSNHGKLAFGIKYKKKTIMSTKDAQTERILIGYANPFNGTLLSRRIVEAIGLPCAALFIWGDEIEYLTRAIKHGIAIATVSHSEFFHDSSNDITKLVSTPASKFGKIFYLVRNSQASTSDHGKRTIFNFRASFITGKQLIVLLLTTQPVVSIQSLFKIVIILHAIVASWLNDDSRRYL